MGQGGTGSKPRENPNIGGTQMSPQVDPTLEGIGQIPGVLNVTTFTNPASAAQKTLELTNGALSGIHTRTSSTGTPLWLPFTSSEDFQEYLDQAKEKDICIDEEDCNTLGF